jgi:hypothetical protein
MSTGTEVINKDRSEEAFVHFSFGEVPPERRDPMSELDAILHLSCTAFLQIAAAQNGGKYGRHLVRTIPAPDAVRQLTQTLLTMAGLKTVTISSEDVDVVVAALLKKTGFGTVGNLGEAARYAFEPPAPYSGTKIPVDTSPSPLSDPHVEDEPDRLAQFMDSYPERVVDARDMLLTASEIENRFQISRQTLANWRRAGLVIGFEYLKNRFRYPADQFLADRTIVKGIAAIRALAPGDQTAWFWLSRPTSHLGRKRPIDLLRQGKRALVIGAAEQHFAR